MTAVRGPGAPPGRGRGPRVLLVAPPFSGHLNPLLTIGLGLRQRGMDVRVATGAARADLVRHHGLPVDVLLRGDPGALERIADTAGPVRSNPVLLGRQLAANLAILPVARAEIDAILRRDRPDVVLADFTAPVAGLAADAAGVPWLTTMPTPFALETRTGTPSYCGGWGPPRHVGHRLRDAAGRAATRATKRTLQRALAARFREVGTGVYRGDGSEAAYSPYGILGLGMRELELPRDWPAHLELVGPVTATVEPWPVAPWLPDGPLVLVTLGTHLPWAKRDLVAQVRRLARLLPDHRFVVSLGDAARARPEPLEVTDGVVVHAHVPYDDVVPRCAAVVHHGGAGITYSAVRAGVPALVCPRDYDQFDFAARVVAAGAGRRVRRLDGRRTADALRQVVTMDRAALTRLAAAAAGYDPVRATERAVHRVLGRAGPAAGGPAGP